MSVVEISEALGFAQACVYQQAKMMGLSSPVKPGKSGACVPRERKTRSMCRPHEDRLLLEHYRVLPDEQVAAMCNKAPGCLYARFMKLQEINIAR